MVLGLGNLLHINKEHHAPVVGSGRGGAGNIHAESAVHKGPGAEEVAAERYAEAHRLQTVHAGRGGAGNVSASSPTEPQDGVKEGQLQEEYIKHEAQAHHAHSGRGGFGNVHHEASVHDGNHVA